MCSFSISSIIWSSRADVSCFFLMIRRPPRSTLDRSSAASDVYKRQGGIGGVDGIQLAGDPTRLGHPGRSRTELQNGSGAVSYTHLRAHETVLDLVCRLLLEKKKYV